MRTTIKFRPDIEGLRGIAVLLVVLYHVGVPGFGGGFVGVDIFFVLSGYLITQLLQAELQASGGIKLRAFYARRIRRLIPAASLVIVATLITSFFVLSPLRQLEVAKSATAAAAYFANVSFALASVDYFAPDVALDPLLHMWSLSVEEQFYLVWPLLILLAWRFGGKRGLIAALAVVAVSGAAFSVWLTEAAPQWAFYGTHSRAWEFAVGGLAGLAAGRVRGGPVLVGLGWVGLVAATLPGMLLTDLTHFPGFAAAPVVLGTAAVMLSVGAVPSSRLGSALSVRPLRVLGRLSYSWYLWHWPALVLTEAALGPLGLLERIAVALGALGISEVAYRFVENPVRHHPRLLRPSASFMLLGALLVATLGTAAGSETATRLRAGGDPAGFLLARSDKEPSATEGCLLNWTTVQQPPCVYGDPHGDTVVVLYGDSHASHLVPALEPLAIERSWKLVVRAKSSCPPAEIPTVDRDGNLVETCYPWRAAVLEELEEVQPDLVIVSWSANNPQWTPAWPSALVTSLRDLDERVGRLVYFVDVPRPGFDLPECLAMTRRSCDFTLAEGRRAPVWEPEALAASGIQFFDFSSELCPDGLCRARLNGAITFRDPSHFTATFAATLAPALGNALDIALAAP